MLNKIERNLQVGKATTFVAPQIEWDRIESYIIRSINREVIKLRCENTSESDYQSRPLKMLYNAIKEGVFVIVEVVGNNNPFIQLLISLTESFQMKRGDILRKEKIFVFAFPYLVIHETFNFIVLITPERFTNPYKKILDTYTEVVLSESILIPTINNQNASNSQILDSFRKETLDFSSEWKLGNVIKQVIDSKNNESGRILFLELISRGLFTFANKLPRKLNIGDELLSKYGLELSKFNITLNPPP